SRATQFSWADLLLPFFGPACFIACWTSSIRSSASASIGGGSSLRNLASALLPASSSPASSASPSNNSFPSRCARASKVEKQGPKGSARIASHEESAQHLAISSCRTFYLCWLQQLARAPYPGFH